MATGRLAAFVGFHQPFEIMEYPVPEPEPGAALVRMSLANICGSDIHWWRGDSDSEGREHNIPRHWGHEGTGRIAALGEGTTTDARNQPLAVGDRVVFSILYPCGQCRACAAGREWCCPGRRRHLSQSCDLWPHFRGSFGEYHYLFPGHTVYKVPDELPDEVVAGANCAMSQVYCGLDVAGVTTGEYVVIQGAGGLGVYAIAIARERGAGKIIVIDRVPERLELAAQFGADELLDMRELTTPEQRIKRVRELTDGWGAEVVVEVVGYPEVVQEGVRMLGQGGRYVEIGNVSPGHTYLADPELWVHGNITIYGNNNYSRRHLGEVLDLLQRTRHKYPFDRIVSRRRPFDEINEAMAEQSAGHVTRTSLVI